MLLPGFILAIFILPLVLSDVVSDLGCGLLERRSPSGVISSPGYPSGYPETITCKWEIIYPQNASLVIRMTDVDIEEDVECLVPPCCVHSWLYLETQQICGRNVSNLNFVLFGGQSIIEFHSTKSYPTGHGFRLVYHVCREDQFHCSDERECVDKDKLCDEIDNCEDGSDELPKNCPEPIKTFEEYKFRCADSGRCIDDLYVCNGENDCSDGSDEANCMKNSIITAVVMGSLACGMIAVLGAAMGWRYYYNRCTMPTLISVGGYRCQPDQGPLDEASLYHLYREPPPSYHEAMRQDGNTPTYRHPTRYMNMTTRRTESDVPPPLPRRERTHCSSNPRLPPKPLQRPPLPLPESTQCPSQSALKPLQIIRPGEVTTQTSSQVIAGDQLYPESSVSSEQDTPMLELSDNNVSAETSGMEMSGQDSDSRSQSGTSMSSLISCESQTSYQHPS